MESSSAGLPRMPDLLHVEVNGSCFINVLVKARLTVNRHLTVSR